MKQTEKEVMAMSNSSLVTYTNLTRNHSGRRTQPITKIAIHHMYAIWTGRQCADYFAATDRQASSNYCIGVDGDIAMSVEEANRAWTTSSEWCDQRAVTIEVANTSLSGDTPISGKSLDALIKLCLDICERNGIKECTFTGAKNGVLQMHKWYAATSCPGVYLGNQFPYIASVVSRGLRAVQPTEPTPSPTITNGLYKVQIGAYEQKQNADKMLVQAKSKGFKDAFIVLEGKLYKVQIGAYKEKANADAQLAKAKALKFQTYLVTPTTAPSTDHVTKSGTWVFSTTVNVRSGAGVTYSKVAQYGAGQVVNIDSTQLIGGIVWGHYIGASSGEHRYVALEENGKAYGSWM